MTDTLTPEKREEIRRRAEAATPGPWRHQERDGRQNQRIEMNDDQEVMGPDGQRSLVSCWATAWKIGGHKSSVANARFIAHARADIPALLSALDAAIERAEKAEESIAKNGGAGILLSRLAEAQAQRDALKARVAELEEIIKDVLGNVAKRLDAALKENSHDKG